MSVRDYDQKELKGNFGRLVMVRGMAVASFDFRFCLSGPHNNSHVVHCRLSHCMHWTAILAEC